jgi:hypothetical protein
MQRLCSATWEGETYWGHRKWRCFAALWWLMESNRIWGAEYSLRSLQMNCGKHRTEDWWCGYQKDRQWQNHSEWDQGRVMMGHGDWAESLDPASATKSFYKKDLSNAKRVSDVRLLIRWVCIPWSDGEAWDDDDWSSISGSSACCRHSHSMRSHPFHNNLCSRLPLALLVHRGEASPGGKSPNTWAIHPWAWCAFTFIVLNFSFPLVLA